MRLLSLKPEEIQDLIKRMEEEADFIKVSAMRFSWYMRGGISYEDVLNLSSREREIISLLIENDGKEELTLKHLDTHPIKNTKLYWLLSRCLLEDPNKRSIIFI